MSSTTLAQTSHIIGDPGEWLKGLGPLGDPTYVGPFGPGIAVWLNLFFKVISAIVGIMTICAAIWFVFQFFISAIQILTSGGDKAKLEEARTRITNAVIGIVVVVAAIFIISLIGNFLGLKILGPWDFITDLWS